MENFVVKHYSSDERPSIKGNGFDGLEVGEARAEAEAFVAFVNGLLVDAERYRGLRSLAREGLLNIKGAQSEVLPDMRTHWLLPTIMCSGPVGGFASFDAAVDTVLHNVEVERHVPIQEQR